MRKLNQAGSLLVPFILVFLLLLCSLGFAGWAYLGRQDYKNNSDAKAAEAVKAAIAVEDARKEAEFAEASKKPVKTYHGPTTFGSVSFDYPRTWSAYVSEIGTGTFPVNGYFSPNYVPDVQSKIASALRVQVLNTNYDQVLKTFDSNVKTGKTQVTPYRADKVPDTLGAKVTGTLNSSPTNGSGTMIILPVRDKTIQIWTESNDYINDFNTIVLPSFTFVP